ncbi:hypothetical protein [Clostridium estertheticum]|uniref:hypothetical protein n=1 Tax=Clostridium estertheticum TaxID=238834 RepID=UPI001C0C96BF|nr:hypothetical protein [Clostridium estertheticum]MBU3187797.1 hypothetical protein [Clostridium estertheticum]
MHVVIVSNLKEIGLYSFYNSSDYKMFLVTDLVNEKEFKRSYYLLNVNNLISPSKNSTQDDLILFEKSQKLMYRFIFICFCEEKSLLPQHTFRNVISLSRQSFDPCTAKVWTQLNGLFLP